MGSADVENAVTLLRENPVAALTIDTEVHPPTILLIRGRVEPDVVDGIPEEYLQLASSPSWRRGIPMARAVGVPGFNADCPPGELP
ncbi:hypothetical protein [Streptomyces pseudovenezuelae]|uniref:Uncharacterized protein n=1 Tax=Streptomyces pseudovenezuelae TaxID=67350 RepID=A0ABT6M2Q0_9ACTN|nr:hypothetical protein [Streptomyces pseudovenezuelae]MDH6222825.1 hypothetical protein [Streptomyces pseudovenezuelae]